MANPRETAKWKVSTRSAFADPGGIVAYSETGPLSARRTHVATIPRRVHLPLRLGIAFRSWAGLFQSEELRMNFRVKGI
jgi:hypothetical protein